MAWSSDVKGYLGFAATIAPSVDIEQSESEDEHLLVEALVLKAFSCSVDFVLDGRIRAG